MAIEQDKGTSTDAAADAAADGDTSEFDRVFAEEAAKHEASLKGIGTTDSKADATTEADKDTTTGEVADPAVETATGTAETTDKPARTKRQQQKDEELEHFLKTASIEQLREAHRRTRTDLKGKAQVIANDRSTISELREKLAAAAARGVTVETTETDDKGKAETTGADKKSALLGPKAEELRTTYPELAGPLDEIAEAVEGRLGKVEQAQGQTQAMATHVEQSKALLEKVPYFKELREDDEFKQWFVDNQNDPTLGPIIKANTHSVSSARDLTRLVAVFREETGYEPPEPASKTADPPDKGAETDASETQDARRRKAQLRSSTSVQGKGSGPTTGPTDDFDNTFAAETAKIEKELREAGRL